MSEFFDNYLNLKKLFAEKREYKRQMARVEALPEDYRYVFQKIQSHMWQFATGAGYDMMQLHYDLVDLFESGAASGKPVLEITGRDVAAFCDGLLLEAGSSVEAQRKKFNRDILRHLRQEE